MSSTGPSLNENECDSAVTFRGTKAGFEVQIQRFESVDAVTSAMRRHLAKAPAFFRGADVVLRFSGVPVLDSFGPLERVTRDFGLRVVAVRSDLEASSSAGGDEKTGANGDSGRDQDVHSTVELAENAAKAVSEALAASRQPAWVSAPTQEQTKMVHGPLRSGSVLEAVGGITIIGDVNPGAELYAGGSIVVLGALRGVAHAGCTSPDAFIWASQLHPQQLRIGRLVARAGDSDGSPVGAEIAYARDGQIIVDSYHGKLPQGFTLTKR